MKTGRIILIVIGLMIFGCSHESNHSDEISDNSKIEKSTTIKKETSGNLPECSCNYGKMNWEEWQTKAEWSNILADGYSYDDKAIEEIKERYSEDIDQIYIFGGMWCPDSELSMPIIFEVLEKANIDNNDEVELYSLDKDKSEPTNTAVQLNVRKVPTVIILKNNIELGRITEFPTVSWESDIASILAKN